MDTEIKVIETFSDFKKIFKKFAKAAYKLPVDVIRATDGETIVFTVEKEICKETNAKIVTVTAAGDYAKFEFTAEASTRVFNKVNADAIFELVTAAIKTKKNAKVEVRV